MFLRKKLSLLLLTIPFLLLTACGGDTTDELKVKKGGECTAEKKCADGLVCMGDSEGATKGTCEEAKTCSAKADCSGETEKTACETAKKAVGGAVKVCSKPVEEETDEKADAGQACSAAKTCKGDLKCIVAASGDAEGVCQEVTVCTDGSQCAEGKVCGDEDKFVLNETDAIKVCKDAEKAKKDEDCVAADSCVEGLFCIVANPNDSKGTCQEGVKCEDKESCKDQEEKKACTPVNQIGGEALSFCTKPASTGAEENASCDAETACKEGLFCIIEGQKSTCKKYTECTADAEVCVDGESCTRLSVLGEEESVERKFCVSN